LNRIDRLHAILTHLQSKKKVTAEEIADRFSISLRTVYRDVKALEESGIPIIGESGIGYSIMEGYRLPPVMFTREEAGALMMGAKLAEQFADSSVKKHYESALYKIKAVLRLPDKEFVDSLTSQISIYRGRMPVDEFPQQYLPQLQKALVEKTVLCMEYYSSYKEEYTSREVEPIGLCYYSSSWHLVAWCRMRNDYRDFRISRIKKLSEKEESFQSARHPSIQEYLTQVRSEAQLQEIVVNIKKEVAKYIGEQKYLYGYVSEEVCGNCIRMKFLSSFPEYLGRWLLSYTDAATVQSPDSFKTVMETLTGELRNIYP
jgi:predicted DNA-binding transcriptional regulator YafY